MTSAAVLMVAAAVMPSTMTARPLAVLRVEVGNVRNAKGRVHIDICPEARFLKDDCPYSVTMPSQVGVTVLSLRLPAGRYAIQAFHDENGNGEIDRAPFGIPKEGVGFSNDARIGLGPPKFDEAAFSVDDKDRTIAFKLRYFIGPSGPTPH